MSFELDEQDALHEQYQNQLDELRQEAIRFRRRQYQNEYYYDDTDVDNIIDCDRDDHNEEDEYNHLNMSHYGELD